MRGCSSSAGSGGYGSAVILDHGRGYTTLYGHMSRIGKMRRGQRIAQGTVIGYVGTTGLSTGPHLHYEFRINGVHRNPLSITMPPPEPLAGAQLAAFRTQTAMRWRGSARSRTSSTPTWMPRQRRQRPHWPPRSLPRSAEPRPHLPSALVGADA